jgi:hypothetical protein
MTPTVDVNIPRFNQGAVAVLTAIAFVLQVPWLVALVFAVVAVSRVGGPAFAPLTRLYVRLIRPRLDPNGPTEVEDARPPRFAQLLGALFLGLATAAFAAGVPVAGWALTLLVTSLSALAASTRICVGCLIYRRVLQ